MTIITMTPLYYPDFWRKVPIGCVYEYFRQEFPYEFQLALEEGSLPKIALGCWDPNPTMANTYFFLAKSLVASLTRVEYSDAAKFAKPEVVLAWYARTEPDNFAALEMNGSLKFLKRGGWAPEGYRHFFWMISTKYYHSVTAEEYFRENVDK